MFYNANNIWLFFTSGASAAAPHAAQSEKITQQLIKEEEEAMAKYKVIYMHHCNLRKI